MRERNRKLLAYLDGALSAEEAEEVESLLNRDENARRFLREVAEQAVVVSDGLRQEKSRTEEFFRFSSEVSHLTRRSRPKRRGVAIITAGAFAAITLLGVWIFGISGDTTIGYVEEVSGTVLWTGESGIASELKKDQPIGSGDLETASDDSLLKLRYHDGTLVVIKGDSIATLSAGPQKQIRMRAGAFAAEVTRQPVDLPMLIRTPSAEIEVLGTRLDVESAQMETLLRVSDGSVRLKRTADGKEVIVDANHQAFSTLESSEELKSFPIPKATSGWKSDFSSRPDFVHGNWIPGTQDSPACLMATGKLIERSDDEPVFIYHAGMRIPWQDPGAILSEHSSTVRISGRLKESRKIIVMLKATNEDGTFIGNYFGCSLSLAPGDYEFDLELGKFRYKHSRGKIPIPEGLSLTSIQVFSTEKGDPGLSVESIEFRSPGNK